MSPVITGASRGIGAAAALVLAEKRFRVVVNYRSSTEEADEVVGAVKAAGGEALAIRADVTEPDDVTAMFAETDRHWGRVDVLVHKSMAALRATDLRRLVVAGGVGANRSLRQRLGAACEAAGAALHFPELSLCTDNGAMIALAAAMRMAAGLEAPRRDYRFSVLPRWDLASLAT